MHVICPHCSTGLNIRDDRQGETVRCPKCKGAIDVPDAMTAAIADDVVPLILAPAENRAHPVGSARSFGSVSRRSFWGITFYILGLLGVVVGWGALIMVNYAARVELSWQQNVGLYLLVLWVNAPYFFVAFLIDVMTDIRWFLQEIHRKS